VVIGLLMSSFSAMQFLFAPIWGRLSDRVGRKPILLLGLAGSVLFYALFGYAANLGEAHEQVLALTLLFIARIGQGIAGATIATAQAVIADCTTPEKRSRGMALIGAAFGIGFTFGPLIGAGALFVWKDAWGAPGYVAAGLSLLSFVLGVWLLPETLRPDSSTAHRRWLDWRGLQNALATPAVGLLIVTFFLATFAFANFESTLALLSRDALAFEDKENFYLFAYIGLMLMLTQGGLYQVLARRGVGEVTFMIAGIVLLMIGMGDLGAAAFFSSRPDALSRGGLLAWALVALAIAVAGFSFLTPSIQSLISRRSDPRKQGEILGVNQSASALSRILGPMIGLPLYHLGLDHILPYALATVLLFFVLLLVPRIR
jgi:DHA1 family tetracycline resistance protein-like MFS transporter